MDLRETNDAFNKLASDVRAEMAELAHQREMLDDVVKSCIQACPEQSSWKCESPAVFVRHLLSMRDAEIAKLKADRAIYLAAIAGHPGWLDASRAEAAKILAALDALEAAAAEGGGA